MNLLLRRVSLSRYFRVLTAFLYLAQHAYGQSLKFSELETQVYELNNAMQYQKAQQLLLPVLEEDSIDAEEKYQASILLSYTYKRLLDYSTTLHFLQTARQFARDAPHRDSCLAFIGTQEAFVYFDTHNYARADSLMRVIEKTGFRYVNLENKAKLVMQQGYLHFLEKQYQRAETAYDRAINWLQLSSPCDLPMIYVKKMQLYAAINRMDKMQNALNKSSAYADSCQIIKYHIYAYSELLAIQKQRKDVAGIAFATWHLDSLNQLYTQADNIANLHTQKETMLLTIKDQRLTQKHYNNLILFAIVLGLVILLAGLIVWLRKYQKQKLRIEAENDQMRHELQLYVRTQQMPVPPQKPVARLPDTFTSLSERQREVLRCMTAGLSNREIADKLFISENTVKYHIKNIYQILDLKDRKDLLTTLNSSDLSGSNNT